MDVENQDILASESSADNVLQGLEVIRYGSRRVIIFIKNVIWFLW